MSSSNKDTKVEKRTEKAETEKIEVHSANSWETADLGDDQRNKKFLRLMGASKKDHHGQFVIGERESTHVRQKNNDEHISEELSDQYTQGMEHRLLGGKRGHLGLGYHPEEEAEKEEEEKEETRKDEVRKDTVSKDEEKEYHEDKREKVQEKERKRDSEYEESDHCVKKMKFVKSSS